MPTMAELAANAKPAEPDNGEDMLRGLVLLYDLMAAEDEAILGGAPPLIPVHTPLRNKFHG